MRSSVLQCASALQCKERTESDKTTVDACKYAPHLVLGSAKSGTERRTPSATRRPSVLVEMNVSSDAVESVGGERMVEAAVCVRVVGGDGA